MSEEQLKLFVTRHLKLIVTIGVIIVAGIIISSVMNRYTLVYISTSGPALQNTKFADPVLYENTLGDSTKLGNPGLHLIRKEVENIAATLGEYVAVEAPVAHPWYGFAPIDLNFTYDKNAEKIAYYDNTSAVSCGTYSASDKTLRSYDCTNPVSIASYSQQDDKSWSNQVTGGFSYDSGSVLPYRGGILGTTGPSGDRLDTSLQYVEADGTTHIYNLPSDLRNIPPTSISVATDTLDSSSSHFAVVAPSGTVYTGTISGDKPTYKEVKPPKSYSTNTQATNCTIRGQKVYCYRGVKIVGDRPDNIDRTQEYITTINLGDSSHDDAKLTGHPMLDFIYATQDGHLYGRASDTLLAFDKHAFGNYSYRTISHNVKAGYGAEADSLYYVKQNSVYKLSGETGIAHKVFYSPNVTPLSFVIDKSTVFILGENTGADSDIVYGYRLTTIDHTSTKPRLIDQLPVNNLPSVTEQQFVGSNYHLTLAVAISKTSGPPINQQEFEAKQKAVLDKLRADKIPVDTLNISFGY